MILDGLYIGGRKCDFDELENISFTYTSSNSESPEAIKNSFSKSVELRGTKNNNQIFSELWNLGRVVTDTSFDPKTRTPFVIYKNSEKVEEGYCELDKIELEGEDIKYSISLYGGLGDFFYNLQGSGEADFNLANLYYEFRKTDGSVYTPEEESNSLLLSWDKDYIKGSWDKLRKDFNEEDKNIDNWITAAPTYSGTYDDFDNDTVLINRNYIESAPEDFKKAYSSLYPETLEDKYSTENGWAKIKLQREYSEWESRDLRSHYQRPAIRTKLILDAVANPYNNGGYDVLWNIPKDDIFWEYYNKSFIVRNRFKFDTEEGVLGDVKFGHIDTWYPVETKPNIHYTELTKSSEDTPSLENVPANVKLELGLNFTIMKDDGTYNIGSGDLYISNKLWWKDSENGYLAKFGGVLFTLEQVKYNGETREVLSQSHSLLNSIQYELEPNQKDNLYKQLFKKYKLIGENVNIKEIDIEQKQNAQKVKYFTLNRDLILGLTLSPEKNYSVELSIRLIEFPIIFKRNGEIIYTTKLYPEMYGYMNVGVNKTESIRTRWATEVKSSNVFSGTSGTKFYTTMNKSSIFSGSKTPFDYLTSFTKLFNLRYRVDNKNIIIEKRSEFYIQEVIDLSNKIDYSKTITIEPNNFKHSNIELELETPETYVDYLYKKKYNKVYGTLTENTGYSFNSDSKNIYEGNSFSNIIDYTIQSPYFNTTKEIYKPEEAEWEGDYTCPTISLAPTYEYTLWDGEESKTETLFGLQSYYAVPTIKDVSSKLCFFDKDNGNVEVDDTICFLEGFDRYSPTNQPMILTDNIDYMNDLNDGNPCFIYFPTDGTSSIGNTFMAVVSKSDSSVVIAAYILSSIPRFSMISDSGYSFIPTAPEVFYRNVERVEYLYDSFWKYYIGDILDRDSRRVELYCKIGKNPREALRKFYWFQNSIWALEEISDKTEKEEFTKCKFIKVKSKNNYR